MKSVTIRGCKFNNNRALQGYAIYIKGEESSTTFSIINNNFNNNEGNTGTPNNNDIIAIEIVSITKENIEPSNTFKNETRIKKFLSFIPAL